MQPVLSKSRERVPDGTLGHALADISVREFRRPVCFRLGARSQSEDFAEDLVFVLFSDEDEPLLLSEDGPLLSDEPDAAALEEPLVVPLLAVPLLGLLSDFSLDPSVALALPERA